MSSRGAERQVSVKAYCDRTIDSSIHSPQQLTAKTIYLQSIDEKNTLKKNKDVLLYLRTQTICGLRGSHQSGE